MGRVLFYTPLNSTELPYSQEQDPHSTLGDIRSQFYEGYHKVAEEYDEEFNKRYEEDLSTTLIFVSIASFLDMYILKWATGWSILRCHFCLYH